jgi:hypothetical protein
MAQMTTKTRDRLDKLNPDFERDKVGTSIYEASVYAPVIFTFDQTTAANAAAQTAFTAPFPLRIVDVIVEGKNAEAAVVTCRKNTTAMATAITAANQAMVHVSAGIVTAELEFAAGDIFTIQTGHANSRCRVTVIAIRK